MVPLAFALVTASLAGSPAAVVPPAEAHPALTLRPKAGIATATLRGTAPFANPSEGPELDLVPARPDPRQAASPSACSAGRSLCYDPSAGRIVYRPARALMPTLPGLTPENISVKRDRIVFRYSF